MNPDTRILVEKHLSCDRSRVWRAMTEPDALAAWWARGDVQPVVGHRFTLDMGPFGPQVCEVVEVVPNERFVFLFSVGDLNTPIGWELADAEGGTRLTLTHSAFPVHTPMGQQAFHGMKAGWPQVLERLAAFLAR